MMQRIVMILGVAVVFISFNSNDSAGNGEDPFAGKPLSFDVATFYSQGGECPEPDVDCARVDIRKVRFLDRSLQEVLDSLQTAVILEEMGSTDLAVFAEGFISEYTSFRNDFPDSHAAWYFLASVKVLHHTKKLVSLQVDRSWYTGGAHGMSKVTYINYSKKKGHLPLYKVFRTDRTAPIEIASEVEPWFRKARGMAGDSSFIAGGFNFEFDKFQLTENFGFDGTNFRFYYNVYDVAAYSYGPTEVLVPVDVLRPYLLPVK